MKKLKIAIALVLGFVAAVSTQNVSAAPFKVVGYEASWDGTVSGIQFSKVTHVDYAFLIPNANGSLQAIDNAPKLQSLVSAGHAAGVKVSISCQTNATDWDALASNAGNRTAFVNNMMNYVNQYNLDGVDIDWEFPTGGNAPNDYAALMSQLSTALHAKGKLLTAAVASWGGEADGVLSSVFNEVDWLNIMDYDNYDGSNTNGAGQSTYDSVSQSLAYWSQRGLPLSKTVMGVPFYGDPNGTYSFAQLIAMGASPDEDIWTSKGVTYGYNGIPTIQQKTTLCLQDNLAGMMIWELGNDATGSDSLLSVMSTIIQAHSTSTSTPQSGLFYNLICAKSGLALDNSGATTNGGTVWQWSPGAGNTNQEWKLVSVGNGYYNLICVKSGLALDNSGATTNGGTVWQWAPASGNTNQEWKLVSVGNGYYNLICARSGLALDNSGATTNGGKVWQWSPGAGNTNQEWRFVLVSTPVASDNPHVAPGGNFDLSNWELQLPVASGTDVVTIPSSQLVGPSGYQDQYFYTNTTTGAMEFWTPENGAHTPNSSFPRSELRELKPGGDWLSTGTHTMTATLVVNDTVEHVCIGQIHIGDGGSPASTKPLLELFYYSTGEIQLSLEQTPAGGNGIPYDIASVPVGTKFNYAIQLKGNAITIIVNGVTKTFTMSSTFNAETFYFKAGDYLQTTGSSATIGAHVSFYALNVVHQ